MKRCGEHERILLRRTQRSQQSHAFTDAVVGFLTQK